MSAQGRFVDGAAQGAGTGAPARTKRWLVALDIDGTTMREDGVITEVGSVSAPADAEVLDADGLVALPGLVDLHVHLREPGREDAETIATGGAPTASSASCSVRPRTARTGRIRK